MSKDQQSLETSRQIRQHLITKWGRIPKSVWKVNWNIKCIELYTKYSEQQKINEQKVGKDFALSGTGARHGQLSAFPQDILQFLVTFLTPDKLSEPGYFGNYLPTVLDPFAGHNSRGETVWRNNRNYIGYDISQAHNKMNAEVYKILKNENETSMIKRDSKIKFINKDSREIDYHEQFDFSITSPPFYDIEYYGDEPEQLGRQKTYNDFIYSLRSIFEKVYRALKQNTYIAVETNDFRRNGTFHTYHADLINILKYCGFEMHDIIICDYGQGFLESFISDIEANKITSKQHSYFAIAKKLPRKTETRVEVRERLINEINNTQNNNQENNAVDNSMYKQIKLI